MSAEIISEREDDTLRYRLVEVTVPAMDEPFTALLVAPHEIDRWLYVGAEDDTSQGFHVGLCDRIARLVGVPYSQFMGDGAAAVAAWHLNTLLHLPPDLISRLMNSAPGVIPTESRIASAPWN